MNTVSSPESSARKILILKLAAIGDITLTCQALMGLNPYKSHEIHWIIEQKYIKLAHSLIKFTNHKVIFHGIDSKKLFNGSFSERISVIQEFKKIVTAATPEQILIFHRDWRYRFIFSFFSCAPIYLLKNYKSHEFTKIKSLFLQVGFSEKTSSLPEKLTAVSKTKKIGILVGGGKNEKTEYLEKRWPHTSALIELLLKTESAEIHLLGVKEDLSEDIELLCKKDSKIINHMGLFSLDQLPEVIKTFDIFIAVDSGPAHIAGATMLGKGKHIFSIFGPTDPDFWAPVPSLGSTVHLLQNKLPCSPCYKEDGNFKTCIFSGDEFQICMKNISAYTVYKLMKSYL